MDAAIRAELVACIEAGAAAREAGKQLNDNPHLGSMRSLGSGKTRDVQIQRVDAWWQGWSEIDLSLAAGKKARRLNG